MNEHNSNRTDATVVRGMTNIYDEVSTSVASAIKQDLVAHFGKGLYYRLKNGEKDIDAALQAFIAETFSKYGVETPPVYDTVVQP